MRHVWRIFWLAFQKSQIFICFSNGLKCSWMQVSSQQRLSSLKLRISIFIYFSRIGMTDSVSKMKCNKLNEKIERISKLIYFILVKLTPVGIILPALQITLINYFIHDLKDDSYFLSFQIMYVCSLINLKVFPFDLSLLFPSFR